MRACACTHTRPCCCGGRWCQTSCQARSRLSALLALTTMTWTSCQHERVGPAAGALAAERLLHACRRLQAAEGAGRDDQHLQPAPLASRWGVKHHAHRQQPTVAARSCRNDMSCISCRPGPETVQGMQHRTASVHTMPSWNGASFAVFLCCSVGRPRGLQAGALPAGRAGAHGAEY